MAGSTSSRRYPQGVRLAYNRSYGGNVAGSYSVTLRPDITLTVGDELHLLDAKFRLQEVERGTAAQEELAGHADHELAKQGGLAKDALQSGNREAARLSDALVVAPRRVRAHALPEARWAGAMRFQRETRRPPRRRCAR